MLSDFYKNVEKKKEKKNIELMENFIYRIDKIIKKELAKGIELDKIDIEDLSKKELSNLVNFIISKDKIFLKSYIDVVKLYLVKYTKYKNFEGDRDNLLKRLSLSMVGENFPKNKILFRKEDIGDKFYIILKGSVSIILVQESYEYLTSKEYDSYLQNLNYYKEYGLLRQILTYHNDFELDSNLVSKIHDNILTLYNKSNLNEKEESDDKDICSPIEYVDRIKPIINKNDLIERKKVKICTYKIVASLKEGDTFGEIALSKNEKDDRRRTATVITETECIMGTILNKIYTKFFRDIEEKNKLTLIGHVLNHTLFRDMTPESFMKYNYFNYFNSVNYKGGDFLFQQGDIRSAIYFIDNGVIDLYTESSFEDISNYITIFKNDINKYNKKYNKVINKNEIDEDYYINREYNLQRESNHEFEKYYTEKRNIKIYKINKKETLGYEDYLLAEDKYFVSAKVISHTCRVFVLEINFLMSLLKDYLLNKNYNITNFERKEMMIQRLRNIKITFLDKFLQNNKAKYSVIDKVRPKAPKKGILNTFQHSNTKIYIKNNLDNKKYKYGIPNESNIFSLKIRRKYTSKNNKIFQIFSLKHKKSNNKENSKMITFNYEREETEKFKNSKIKNRTMTLGNIKNLKSNISFNIENKVEPILLPNLRTLKSNMKKRKEDEKYCLTEQKIINYKITSLIPKISKLSNKFMIKEYGNSKNKREIKNRKNMTQLDFLFYDYFFTERGNKNYSKKPLINEK